jgi:hypothetical protein
MILITPLSTGICFPVLAWKYWRGILRGGTYLCFQRTYVELLLNSAWWPTTEVSFVARFSSNSVNSVAVATGYWLGDRWTEVPFSVGICLVNRVQTGPWGPPNLLPKWVSGALSPGAKKPGLITNVPLLPRSRTVKLYPLPHASSRHVAKLIKRKDTFTSPTWLP